jgi:hypothetical protein
MYSCDFEILFEFVCLQVGDMISVIDMPPPEESVWWRGKRGFQVGFFPCECVAIIGDKVPHNLQLPAQLVQRPTPDQPSKPVLRKHGKLIAFFRSFILSRPSRRRLKQSGILKERVFGCDLGEHLLNSGHESKLTLLHSTCDTFVCFMVWAVGKDGSCFWFGNLLSMAT